jgi:hypothetical protein
MPTMVCELSALHHIGGVVRAPQYLAESRPWDSCMNLPERFTMQGGRAFNTCPMSVNPLPHMDK